MYETRTKTKNDITWVQYKQIKTKCVSIRMRNVRNKWKNKTQLFEQKHKNHFCVYLDETLALLAKGHCCGSLLFAKRLHTLLFNYCAHLHKQKRKKCEWKMKLCKTWMRNKAKEETKKRKKEARKKKKKEEEEKKKESKTKERRDVKSSHSPSSLCSRHSDRETKKQKTTTKKKNKKKKK